MSYVILLFATALALSAVSAYYSIVGLMAIFAAAAIPIAVMGGTLEVAKLVTTSWLYRNWKTSPKALKYYFSVSVAILMLITSLGVFGFLSKAHMDQTLVSGDSAAKIQLYDEKIRIAKENIDANRKQIKQMDETVDQVMGRSTTEAGADKAVAIRKSQQRERSRLFSEIEAEQKIISKLNEERAPIAAEIRKIDAEVGPIKYIAQFVYGEASTELLEKAVTWVIILIIIVFDPLAVLLFIAANHSLVQLRPKMISTKLEMESFEPIPMTKDELTNATTLYHRDQDSM